MKTFNPRSFSRFALVLVAGALVAGVVSLRTIPERPAVAATADKPAAVKEPQPVVRMESTLTREHRYLISRGEITNVTTVPLRRLRINISCHAADGSFVTAGWTYADYSVLLPGQTTTFTDYITDNPAITSCSAVPVLNGRLIRVTRPEPRTKADSGHKSRTKADSGHGPRSVQSALKGLGYDPGPVDGIMGNKTRKALEGFQRDQQIPVTGRADAATRAALAPQMRHRW